MVVVKRKPESEDGGGGFRPLSNLIIKAEPGIRWFKPGLKTYDPRLNDPAVYHDLFENAETRCQIIAPCTAIIDDEHYRYEEGDLAASVEPNARNHLDAKIMAYFDKPGFVSLGSVYRRITGMAR
jgi:hypothetical protein